MGGGAVESAAGAPATVTVRFSNGSKFPVEVALDSTVASFKVLVAARCDVPPEQQRLIHRGRILKDAETLESYGVESEHTIHLVRGAVPSSSPIPAGSNVGDTKTPRSQNADTDARGRGSTEGGGLGGVGLESLFPGLGILGMDGTSGLTGAGLPELDQMEQLLSQNPNMMRDMMNMPFVQNLLNNPDMLRNIITSSPQMQELLDRNPELSHILNDSNTLRQTLEVARNPGLMREMMRNTDRAMSNIESSPEGFNMLRRMYETVQEPFLNATTMDGVGTSPGLTSQDSTTNSNNASESAPVPNTNPLPNPWNAGVQANNARAPPTVDGRAPGISGLAGLGLPNLQGSIRDSSFVSQALQNPAMSQMMQSLLSNPEFVNQMFNPAMRNMLENNPQIREMLQNPEFLRQLSSPDTLQQLLSLQQSFSSLGFQLPGQDQTQRGTAAVGAQNSRPAGLDQLIQMFSNLGSGGFGVPNISDSAQNPMPAGMDQLIQTLSNLGTGGFGVSNTSDTPPEELYATQLAQLREMGFFDTQENIRVLVSTAGNVNAAVERLLGNPPQ